jgi:hypothetical protein
MGIGLGWLVPNETLPRAFLAHFVTRTVSAHPDWDVCYWHIADMLNALTNVRFWGKADSDQPLLTNLDL